MIRGWFSRAARTLLFRSGVFRVLLARNERMAFILMLHRLRPPGPAEPSLAGMAQDRFEHLVRYLRRSLCPLSVEELVAARAATGRFPRNAVCLTFDDGFRDFYELAFPVLAALRVPATVFVTTGFIEGRVAPWWEEARPILADPAGRAFVAEHFGIAATPGGPAGAAGRALERRLKALPREETLGILAEACAVLGMASAPPPSMMGWDEIRELSRAGIEIAAHTATHPNLARLDGAELVREIAAPRLELERRLERAVSGFAYPYGQREDISPAAVTAARAAGYAYACSACEGAVDRDADLFRLRRVSVPDDTLPMAASAFLKHLV